MWGHLQDTPWGRKYFRFLVWHDDQGRILSSMKLYRPNVRLGDRQRRACAIGAVFTPREERGRGHAASMLERVLEEAREAGDGPAILFSDIGTGYYELLGFRALPAEEAFGTLGRASAKAPAGWSLRPMLPDDLDAVREAHDAWCARRPLAFLRDSLHWQFLLERARTYFNRFDRSGLERRYRVAMRAGRFAGYVVSVEGGSDWDLREVGAVGDDPEALVCILRAAAADARAAGMRRVFGWIPRAFAALVPEWKLRHERRQRAIPMLRPTDGPVDLAQVSSLEDAFVPYLDQF
jgi:GNAT superfamily N-acetyltransferase